MAFRVWSDLSETANHPSMLNMIRHGTPTNLAPLMIVHGLYGSAKNWGVIAKRMSDLREVIAVDLRNHGDSFWADSHSYGDMANDLAQAIDHIGGPVDLLGHSMGGKASMALALTQPELVNRLIIADIAPVTYAHSQLKYIHAMRSVDLSKVSKRTDATTQLAAFVPEISLRSFFTQSLELGEKRWKLNLDVLEKDMPKIMSFPPLDGVFEGPTLFLSGASSDYVLPKHRSEIRKLFPQARFAKIKDAGHWLHAEKPREFEASLRAFLD